MAGPFYVDPAGDNSNGLSWATAWITIQTAFDTAVAGEIIYCRGTQTLAAAIDVDINAGTNAAGWIKVIGCNAAGNVDGTRFILNGNAADIHILTAIGAADMYWMENVEVKNTGGAAKNGFNFSTSSIDGWILINCCANNCSGHGFFNSNIAFASFIRCISYSNTLDGFYGSNGPNRYFFCCARDNSRDGFSTLYIDVVYGCITHGNTDDGIGVLRYNTCLINTVIDGNADDGIELAASTGLPTPLIIGCRITNQSGAGSIGLNANSEPVVIGWCYFEDNDGDNIQNATLHQFIPLEGGALTSNLEDLANTEEGYVDKANHDFSTRYVDAGDPDLRRVAITIPWS